MSTFVVLVNFNGWQDTVRCIASLLHSTVRPVIVVCDNGSTDGSLNHIARWLSGHRTTPSPPHPLLTQLCLRSTRKVRAIHRTPNARRPAVEERDADVIVIDNTENLGFAGGCNAGIRYAMDAGADHIWLLNNDSMVRPDTLSHMLDTLAKAPSRTVCGATILSARDPMIINTLGGNRVNRWTGIASDSIGRGDRIRSTVAPITSDQLDYLSGACMLIPRGFVDDVGMMSDDFFLYYEEIDWFLRAGSRWRMAHAPEALVYHVEGQSIGSGTPHSRASLFSEKVKLRARMIFMRKHYPRRFLISWAAGWMQAINRARRGQWNVALAMAYVLVGGWREHPLSWMKRP